MDMKTFYRKLPHEDFWHFCRKCENWPQFGYGERDETDSASSALCLRCIQYHRSNQCEWLHLEMSPGPLGRVRFGSTSVRVENGDLQ